MSAMAESTVLIEMLPRLAPRARRRLEAQPRLAEGWSRADGQLTTARGDVVRWIGVAPRLEELSCTCLLAPHCLHVAATLVLLGAPLSERLAASALPEPTPALPPLPEADPALVAALLPRIPPRARRALEQSPRMAAAWAVGPEGLTSPRGEQVRWPAGGVVHVEELSCTCLLAPQCLHVAAALSLMSTSTAAAALAQVPAPSPAPSPIAQEPLAAAEPAGVSAGLGPEAQGAVALAVQTMLRVLQRGLDGEDTLREADLSRAAQAARLASMPRLTRALEALVQGQRGGPQLGEVLLALHGLGALGGRLLPEAMGDFRREYQPVPTLKLHGLFGQPIEHGNLGGVSVVFVDSQGRLRIFNDLRPDQSAAQVWQRGSRLGNISPRQMVRGTMALQEPNATVDGWLGAGQATRAVWSAGLPWTAEPIQARFSRPLQQQIGPALTALRMPPATRPAGAELLFLDGLLMGGSGRSALLARQDGPIHLICAQDSAQEQANLRLLCRARGVVARVIGLPHARLPRVMHLLAIDIPEAPEGEGERVSLCMESLPARIFAGPVAGPALPDSADPLLPIAHHLRRVASRGREALPAAALASLESDARRLEARQMPNGAALLRGLGASVGRAEAFASAVLALHRYMQVASEDHLRRAWSG